jgi:protein-S-isoprenylcysteine O-methyltransferase Ste14
VGICILAVNTSILPPELIAERGQPRENVKGWDKAISGLLLIPTLGVLVVAGLDERFGWSPALPLAAHLAGLALMVLGQALFTWAMASNKFFSTAVRIQMDRSHTVATGGPYRYVRHPGYVGYIVTVLAVPLILGSLWALIPEGLVTCLFIVRTALEDRTLREELDGYEDYALHVRYRLLPGVW